MAHVISPQGRLDLSAVTELHVTLREAPAGDLVIDLTDVTLSSDAGSVDLTTVTLDGESLTFVFPFGDTEVTVKAKANDGALKGEWSVTGDDGSEYSGAWTAKRKD